jgi:hypothetical protein
MSEIQTSPNKARKPQARTIALRNDVLAVMGLALRWTLRQLFYQCTVRGVLAKTEQAYKRLSDHLVQMRLDGTVPFERIVDGHRMRRNLGGWASPKEALARLIENYRYDRWEDQPAMVEIWCEKDALSGQILPLCEEYGITYVACKGFASLSLAHETAKIFARRSKPTYVYYFGDFDPSGMHIDRSLSERLRQFGANVTVERVALLPHQVERYHLPTRPTKKSDSRSAGFVQQFGDAAIELDALPPDTLELLVRRAIERHIDQEAWNKADVIDNAQRGSLADAFRYMWSD